MNTNSGTLPQKAIPGYSGNYSGRFKTMDGRGNILGWVREVNKTFTKFSGTKQGPSKMLRTSTKL
jgi:hypothetical protein